MRTVVESEWPELFHEEPLAHIQTGRNGGTTLEGGVGISSKLARNVTVYGDASYLSSFSGDA